MSPPRSSRRRSLLPAAEAHYSTARLGYRSKVIAVKPAIPGVRLRDPLRRRPDLARQPKRQDDRHRRLQRRAVSPLRAGRDLRQHPLPGRLPQPGPLRAVEGRRSRRPRRRSPKWEKLASGDVWAWHDHRIHYMNPIPPPQISAAPRKPHHVFDWKVPATDERQALLHRRAASTTCRRRRRSFPVTLVYRARDPDRRRDGRPLRPPPRASPLAGLETSTLPSARRMSSTLTSISSPSR